MFTSQPPDATPTTTGPSLPFPRLSRLPSAKSPPTHASSTLRIVSDDADQQRAIWHDVQARRKRSHEPTLSLSDDTDDDPLVVVLEKSQSRVRQRTTSTSSVDTIRVKTKKSHSVKATTTTTIDDATNPHDTKKPKGTAAATATRKKTKKAKQNLNPSASFVACEQQHAIPDAPPHSHARDPFDIALARSPPPRGASKPDQDVNILDMYMARLAETSSLEFEEPESRFQYLGADIPVCEPPPPVSASGYVWGTTFLPDPAPTPDKRDKKPNGGPGGGGGGGGGAPALAPDVVKSQRPLQALCPNTTDTIYAHQVPLDYGAVLGSFGADMIAPPHPKPRKDKWGNVQLGAADLDLSISFYEAPHFEVWDQPDDAYIAWPAQINLTMKHPQQWDAAGALSPPNVSLLDIQCRSQSKISPFSNHDADSAYTVSYSGAKTCDEKGVLVPMVHENGICIEPEWVRVFARPSAGGGAGKRGWYLKVWVPIPTRLFLKKETRMFTLDAHVWIGEGDEDVVGGEAEISVSHLRRERAML